MRAATARPVLVAPFLAGATVVAVLDAGPSVTAEDAGAAVARLAAALRADGRFHVYASDPGVEGEWAARKVRAAREARGPRGGIALDLWLCPLGAPDHARPRERIATARLALDGLRRAGFAVSPWRLLDTAYRHNTRESPAIPGQAHAWAMTDPADTAALCDLVAALAPEIAASPARRKALEARPGLLLLARRMGLPLGL